MTSQRSTDAPQNLEEFKRWRDQKSAHMCNDFYLEQVNRKWRMIGKLARDVSALRNAEDHN